MFCIIDLNPNPRKIISSLESKTVDSSSEDTVGASGDIN